MESRQKAVLLAETKLFDKLDEAWLDKVAGWAGYKVCKDGETIFLQDDPGDRLFIIVEGVVKLLVRSKSGESIELVRQTRPAVLGELAVLDGGRRSASAEAVGPTTLLYLTGDELLSVIEAQPQVAKALLQRLAGVVRRTTEDLTALAFLDLEGRVARRILALADGRTPPQTGPTAARNRRITQQEIGQMVSGSRQRVNVALRSLEGKGLIALTESGIEIRDRDRLQQRADQ